MYSTTLELLGLGLFFVVNLAYSVMLGNDLFSFFKNSSSDPSNRWTKILAVLILIALSMNFVSSVLTMMTLGNLQAKFGKKGEKLMLSPKYRSELSSIEGMFVAIIVLITVLSFRLYFSPTQMAEGVFAWLSQTIPDDYIKWGHMLLAFVVMGVWIWTQWLGRRVRVANRLVVESGEMFFLRLFVTAQVVGLFVLVTNHFRGVPLPGVLLGGGAVGVALLTQHTAFGRYLYAVGGNEEAARVSGVPMDRVVIGAFGIMGAITALAGLMQTAYVGSSTTTVGELMELDAIAACVIGGVSLRGGRGSVTGVLFGALIMATLLNGMTLLSVAPEMKLMVRGAVLVLAVWVDLR
jgi:ABC-type xylose transport system permease subunit